MYGSDFAPSKVIDIDTFKKVVTSVCYDKQHVCADLQPFFTLEEPTAVKWTFYRGIFTLLFETNPLI